MATDGWHVDGQLWQAYAAGRLDQVAEASIDAHVNGCTTCQAGARAAVSPATTEELWRGIQAEVRRPELPRTLRWLRRLGVREDDLALLAASDGFLLPWATAVGSALVCALLTGATSTLQQETFALLAPLVPVLAVVAAFDAIESVRDLVRTTPYSKLRLSLLRTTATLVVAIPATMPIGLVIPGLEQLAFSWLLPALALTGGTLVLLTWLGPWTATGVVAATWTATVIGTVRTTGVDILSAPASQALFAALACALAVALVLRTSPRRLLGEGI